MSTTQQLIGEIQRGNGHAREELFRRYALRVLFLVRARMGPKLRLKEESGDLAQEALRRSLAGLDGFVYASDAAFLGFLVTTVERTIQDRIDHWKAQMRDPGREVTLDFGHSVQATAPLDKMADRAAQRPHEILERREDLDRLAKALDILREQSLEYWELVLAVNLEGRSFAEIAGLNGATPDAVKQKAYRAKRALVRIFENLESAMSNENK